jgi:hypothetical protein
MGLQPPSTPVGKVTTLVKTDDNCHCGFWGYSFLQSFKKGTVSQDFLLLVFFRNPFPPSPRVSHEDRFNFFRKFAEIFASQGAPPVSTTPVAKLQFAISIYDTGGK